MSDILEKLKALAEKGVGGEAENAKKILKNMCEKQKIHIDDIGDKPQMYRFKVSGKFDFRLLSQIYAFCGYRDKDMFYRRFRKGEIGLELKREQYIELSQIYEVLRAAFRTHLKKEEKMIFEAFIHRHELYPKNAPKQAMDNFTHEDYVRALECIKRAENIDKVEIRTAIGGQNGD
jgi:hypothetical protein